MFSIPKPWRWDRKHTNCWGEKHYHRIPNHERFYLVIKIKNKLKTNGLFFFIDENILALTRTTFSQVCTTDKILKIYKCIVKLFVVGRLILWGIKSTIKIEM